MPDVIEPGTVWLVGAGPGDPDLLTSKALRLIAAADVIFFDALVGRGVIDLIPAATARINVGKRAGRHSLDQRSINDLIVGAAQAGKRVVRLKGGDPSIFGRSAEEMEACIAHGIAVSICPGITTACAAAASAGVSLTLRGHARKLTFVTAHARAGEALDLDWAALADPQATLVIYMGRSVARELSSKLQSAGLPAATAVLVVENASLPDERIVRTRLDLLELAVPPKASGPTIMMVGHAVGAPSDPVRAARAHIAAGS
ncbi:MAG: uroporphyrinogen-III C-methyltransferase [Pseudomonadota bacterium]